MKIYYSLSCLIFKQATAASRLRDLANLALAEANLKNPELNALDFSQEELDIQYQQKNRQADILGSSSSFKKNGDDSVSSDTSNWNVDSEDVSIFSGRSMNLMLANALDNLDGYGCWCYFDDQFTSGKSQPVDQLDGYCKELLEGYQCAIMDGFDDQSNPNEQECVPWMTTYHAANLGSEDVVRECEQRNRRSACGRHTCIIESTFMSNVFRYLLEGGRIFIKNRHDRGFDVESSCPVLSGPNSDKACCGEYPNRKPYKTLGGSRGCCQSKTYNAVFMQCCGDGTVQVACAE